jgi:hypothetical protein
MATRRPAGEFFVLLAAVRDQLHPRERTRSWLKDDAGMVNSEIEELTSAERGWTVLSQAVPAA